MWRTQKLRGKCDVALERAMKAALRDAGRTPEDVGHINAHGLSTTERDADEARAIQNVFGARASDVPVTALKSYFGNLGAGSAVVELIASAAGDCERASLPPVLNYKTADPECRLAVAAEGSSAWPQLLEFERDSPGPSRGALRGCCRIVAGRVGALLA